MTVPQRYRTLRCVVLVVFLTLVTGCGLMPQSKKAAELSGSGMDMFAPVSMRVHPLSRVVTDQSGCKLQARLEFLDPMGDVGKGVGVVLLRLFEYQTILPNHRGRELGKFTIPLERADANRAHWDSITRTYLFEFPMTAPAGADPNAKFVLSARFVMPNGTELKNDAAIGGK